MYNYINFFNIFDMKQLILMLNHQNRQKFHLYYYQSEREISKILIKKQLNHLNSL